jgi:hypothetical protein
MDENPYQAPRGDQNGKVMVTELKRWIEAVCIAAVWMFNFTILGFIVLIVVFCILGCWDSYRLQE